MNNFFIKIQNIINLVGDFVMKCVFSFMAGFWLVFIFLCFFYLIYKGSEGIYEVLKYIKYKM